MNETGDKGLHPAPLDRVLEAAVWAAKLFRERTIAVAEGRGRIDEALPDSRVSWSEPRDKFDLYHVDDRSAFQPLYEKELKRLKLLQVLRRKETAEDWVNRVGKG